MDYILVLISTLLLAFQFAFSKKYQMLEGTGLASGLRFNLFSGLTTAVIFFALAGFRVEFSWFSLLMAALMAFFSGTYNIVGFRVLESGNMALYSIFLMSGGMVLPYFFGGIFLSEVLSWPRIVGVLIILAAVILSNKSEKAGSKMKLSSLGLYLLIFLLNGGVSIVSKCHQVASDFHPVDSTAFVMYAGIGKAMLSCLLLLFVKGEKRFSFGGRKALPMILSFSLVSGISYLLQLIGAKNLPASVLYPMITGGSIIFSTLSGKAFFKESVSRYQWASVGLCFVGTLLFLW